MNSRIHLPRNIADVTDEQAAACLAKWIKILRLDFWDIHLHVLTEADYALLHGTSSNAHVNMTYVKLIATVDINEASDDPFEYCLVHELVHVLLGAIDNYWEHAIDQCGARAELNGVRDHEMEKVTHQIARALIDAHSIVIPVIVPPKKAKR